MINMKNDSLTYSSLPLIMENQFTSEESISIAYLTDEMDKSGYTKIASSIGIRTLLKSGMIETFRFGGWNNDEYIACRLTDKGEE